MCAGTLPSEQLPAPFALSLAKRAMTSGGTNGRLLAASFYVYMLRCRDGSYYVGHTDNLEGRLAEHEAGLLPGYTHTRRPVRLVWSEATTSRIEALEVERQLKGWSRAKPSGGRKLVSEGSGHNVHLDRPADAVAAITDMVARVR